MIAEILPEDMGIRCVVFDIGETLRNDSGEFGAWADWIGVPRHTFSALIGALKVTGRETDDVFGFFRPNFNLDAERKLRKAAGLDEQFGEADLYPDVRSSLSELRRRGLWVGIAGNQSLEAKGLLEALELPVDAIATSGSWGIKKPDPRFFDRLAKMVPARREETLYVGDHRDHDIVAAKGAGFKAALIRRGPWGHLWAADPITNGAANFIIDSLNELPNLLRPVRDELAGLPENVRAE